MPGYFNGHCLVFEIFNVANGNKTFNACRTLSEKCNSLCLNAITVEMLQFYLGSALNARYAVFYVKK